MTLNYYVRSGILLCEGDKEELAAIKSADAPGDDTEGATLQQEIASERERLLTEYGKCKVEVRLAWQPNAARRRVKPMRVSAEIYSVVTNEAAAAIAALTV
jgi:hypothetical protein